MQDEDELAELADPLASLPPTSQAPRLHAILACIATHAPPPPALRLAPPAAPGAAFEAGREAVLGHLAAALGGDRLAAQYLLLQLVGRCGERAPAGMPSGALWVHGPPAQALN
jgi:hypothetical protein